VRGSFVTVLAVLAIVPSTLSARSDEIPTLDVRPVCRGIAKQSTDPGVGKKGEPETFQRCMESEHVVREQLKQVWAGFSTGDKKHCVALAKTGGLPSYTELITCLEMVRDVRALRSAAAPASAADTTTPASSSSMPSAESASQPTSTKEPPKTEGATRAELEEAKAEAQTARASEALTQRKLVDVEAALQGTKDEAKRATAEAERSKADAQAARESEAAAKRKLAEVEAARAAAEKACLSSARPGLAGRLRQLFKQPSSKNP
jgi:hypothetical protein